MMRTHIKALVERIEAALLGSSTAEMYIALLQEAQAALMTHQDFVPPVTAHEQGILAKFNTSGYAWPSQVGGQDNPLLKRLEEIGLVSAGWDDGSLYFSLTATGHAAREQFMPTTGIESGR